MNKKAQFSVARKIIFWAIIMFVITIILIAFVILIGGYRNKLTNVPKELKGELFSLRFVHNPDCFAYSENGRVYPGIIDLEKFTDERLKQCYLVDEETSHKDYNFHLRLENKDLEIFPLEYYKNRAEYPIKKNVLVKEGNDFVEDTLTIFVQYQK